MLTDSHCHLDHLDLTKTPYQSLSELLAAARQRGVTRFLSVAVNLDTSRQLLKLAGEFPEVKISVGVHPLQQELPALPDEEELFLLGSHAEVIAIGETGLDNYYGEEHADWQRESFIRHLRVAGRLAKPVIVHSRNAGQETLELLDRYADKKAAGVLHCFTESWEMAEALLELGFYISFSGIITFNSAKALREVVKQTPLERILVETDSPWLAPVPYRGKQNEPKYVYEVAQCVAELKEVDLATVAAVTNRNFNTLFKTA